MERIRDIMTVRYIKLPFTYILTFASKTFYIDNKLAKEVFRMSSLFSVCSRLRAYVQSTTKTYFNTISVVNKTHSSLTKPIVFRVYCQYKMYDQRTFEGLGVYW